MTKNDIQIHPHISEYLENLSRELGHLSVDEREQHVTEIKGHFNILIQGKVDRGKSFDKAVDEILRKARTPKELALQITSAEQEVQQRQDIKSGDFQQRTNLNAVTSLTLGIISLVLLISGTFAIFLAIPSLILGFFALIQVKKINLKSRRMALIGIVCGAITILAFLLFLWFGEAPDYEQLVKISWKLQFV